ncbi:MAG: lysophospholipid acyltransferase family protein [Chlamydiales bacterium]
MIRIIAIFLVRIYAVLFYRHKVYGKQNFIKKGGGIVTPNHSSYLDPPFVGISCPSKVHFLARDTLFNNPFFGALIRRLHTHPVHRGGENVAAMKKVMELVEEGNKVVIFPEGKRSETGQLQEGQLGVGMLVYRLKCPVTPVYVHGTFDAWGPNRRYPKLRGVRSACVIGTPIDFADINTENKKEAQKQIVEKIMQSIANLRDWYLEGAKGTPP